MRLEFKGSCLKQDRATFTLSNVVNLFPVFELTRWSQDLNADFTLKDCLFGADVDPDKYSYSGYGIGLDFHSLFSVPNFDWGKIVTS